MNVYMYPDGYHVFSYFKFSDFEDSIIDLEELEKYIKVKLKQNYEFDTSLDEDLWKKE